MHIRFTENSDISSLSKLLKEAADDNRVKSIFILSCDENNYNTSTVDSLISSIEKPLFGGVFPQIILNNNKYSKGLLVIGIPYEVKILEIPNLSHSEIEFSNEIQNTLHDVSALGTVFIIVDGFARQISSLIDNLYYILGLTINYIGGGAGSLSMVQKPCLYTNKGMVQDSALLAFCTIKSSIGVSHGWKPISGPYKVTESKGNCIISLNWEPAYDVYKSVISKYDNREITADNFFSICKSFPFGINKLDAEKIIRDPIKINENNEIVCVGEIPQGSFINIMKGDIESLLSASKEAYSIAKCSFPENIKLDAVFFIDCISRVLFLEDNFQKELTNVYTKDIPLFGALTIGEIANCGMDYLEFYNKTAVVGFLGGYNDE